MNEINRELLEFISECPSMFHTCAAIAARLDAEGFVRLSENDPWDIVPGGRYYVTRNGSSIIAFTASDKGPWHFRISAAHGDSPTYKLKDVPELSGPGSYLRLNVEPYGGMIHSTWLDRPLGLAGRVVLREGDSLVARLLHVDRDILLIPNLCIHFNREINSGYSYNPAVDLCPLFSAGALGKGGFKSFLAGELGAEPEQVAAWDLYLVNRQRGCVWGAAEEFVSAPKLDNLMCTFAGLRGFLRGSRENGGGAAVYCCFDNEEVGSCTKQGAESSFLMDTLRRMSEALGHRGEEDYLRAVAGSFFLSSDNAHAVHPNHPEKSDAENAPVLNGGVVIKEAASQSYMTDAFSRAVAVALCEKAGVPWQTFANRSDVRGGSTLGNHVTPHVSLHGADIGLAQLAMHSAYETAGAKDAEYMARMFETYFAAPLQITGAERVRLG